MEFSCITNSETRLGSLHYSQAEFANTVRLCPKVDWNFKKAEINFTTGSLHKSCLGL